MLNQKEELELAKKYGWDTKPDSRRGDGWFSFTKGDGSVWQCFGVSGVRWCRAELVNGRYMNHLYFDLLEDAFNNSKSY